MNKGKDPIMAPNPTTPNQPPHSPGRRHAGRAQKDGILDPYQRTEKLSEPSLCQVCGAVYLAGHWHWAPAPVGAVAETCPACRRTAEHFPAGIVTLTGFGQDGEEMIRLARNQEEAEKREHPLNRIMAIEETAEHITITTTDIHLPHRIGEALERTYRGKVKFHFDEDGYFVRVDWER